MSRDVTGSTSAERQREVIESYARMHDHTIVGWATDMDVSGSLSPWDTPEFGDWLRRPQEWDVVCAWKLDRFGRTLFELNDLFSWCLRSGHTLACVEDQIDLSTWTGRLVAAVIAGVAEGELEAIRTRNKASRKKLREIGRWHGGQPPYGYRKVGQKGAWYLEPDPDKVEIIEQMIEKVLDRKSLLSIAKDLNARKIPGPQGGQWHTPTVRRILLSRSTIGESLHKDGRPVIGEDGLPVQQAEPLIPIELWKRGKAAVEDRKRAPATEYGTGLLLHVVKCSFCEGWMYHFVKNKDGKLFRYWRCSQRTKDKSLCDSQHTIPAEQLEAQVEELFLDEIGDIERQERVYIDGDDTQAQLDQVKEAINRARKESDLGLYDGDEDSYAERMKLLVGRRKELEANPSEGPRWELRGLGETYREAWQRMDIQERRNLMISTGVQFWASTHPWYLRIHIPHDLMEQAVPGYKPHEVIA